MNAFLKAQWKWLALALLVVIGVLLYSKTRGKTVGVVQMERGNLTQLVAATGRVNSPMRTDLSSEVAAKVLTVLVREGDKVKAGAVLAQLDDSQARAALQQAQAALREANGKIQQQEQVGAPQSLQNLQQAQTAFDVAQREQERARDLVAKGFYSRQKLDETQRTLDAARTGLENAKLQAQANASNGVEPQLLRARLEQAQANHLNAQALVSKHKITAPYDAVVLSRNTEPGSMAQLGKVLLEIASTTSTRIDASIDEKNLHILSMGMKARAATDAFPNQIFEASLSYIAPSVDAQKGTVDVRLDVPNPPAFLRTDMTLSVELIGQTRKNVWLLPTDALRDADRASPWVLAVRDGVATRVDVKTGLRGVGTVEITQGLEESDSVIPTSQTAAVGDRVKASSLKSRAKGLDVPQGMFR
jgi:HlyD family secretion protein